MLPSLEAERARVAHLEAQISHLERSLYALREEKFLAQERLNSYKYPVLELPNEIISDIFMHFLPTYPLCPLLIGLHSPTVLTHVCRSWREIALSTPALWCAIGTSYDNDIPLKQKAHIFDIWLRRSRFCPLSLKIVDWMDVAAILAAVAPHRARWEHLVFHFPPSHLHTIIDGAMPLLRHLDLALHTHSATDILAFREVPLLRTVVLNRSAALSIILPWAQLTSLTLVSVLPRDCDPILQQTSNLVRCELQLEGMYGLGGNDQPRPDIALPYLELLALDGGPVKNFLKTFIVPALRRLKISEEFLGPSPIDSLTGFISKSDCNPEEVHITGPHSPQQSYRKAFPSIRKFSFEDPSESVSDASNGGGNSDSDKSDHIVWHECSECCAKIQFL
ncbi:hypothetical protein B0H13DRAFT_2561499 [Mycena leptocephala]|nr:hypothetical protein B0H13DRAFT_2561499 [Mycena leptocephala]